MSWINSKRNWNPRCNQCNLSCGNGVTSWARARLPVVELLQRVLNGTGRVKNSAGRCGTALAQTVRLEAVNKLVYEQDLGLLLG